MAVGVNKPGSLSSYLPIFSLNGDKRGISVNARRWATSHQASNRMGRRHWPGRPGRIPNKPALVICSSQASSTTTPAFNLKAVEELLPQAPAYPYPACHSRHTACYRLPCCATGDTSSCHYAVLPIVHPADYTYTHAWDDLAWCPPIPTGNILYYLFPHRFSAAALYVSQLAFCYSPWAGQCCYHTGH